MIRRESHTRNTVRFGGAAIRLQSTEKTADFMSCCEVCLTDSMQAILRVSESINHNAPARMAFRFGEANDHPVDRQVFAPCRSDSMNPAAVCPVDSFDEFAFPRPIQGP